MPISTAEASPLFTHRMASVRANLDITSSVDTAHAEALHSFSTYMHAYEQGDPRMFPFAHHREADLMARTLAAWLMAAHTDKLALPDIVWNTYRAARAFLGSDGTAAFSDDLIANARRGAAHNPHGVLCGIHPDAGAYAHVRAALSAQAVAYRFAAEYTLASGPATSMPETPFTEGFGAVHCVPLLAYSMQTTLALDYDLAYTYDVEHVSSHEDTLLARLVPQIPRDDVLGPALRVMFGEMLPLPELGAQQSADFEVAAGYCDALCPEVTYEDRTAATLPILATLFGRHFRRVARVLQSLPDGAMISGAAAILPPIDPLSVYVEWEHLDDPDDTSPTRAAWLSGSILASDAIRGTADLIADAAHADALRCAGFIVEQRGWLLGDGLGERTVGNEPAD